MRHEANCIGVLALAGLCLHVVALNVDSRQRGYRIAEQQRQAEILQQVIGARAERCRRLLQMPQIEAYAAELGISQQDLWRPDWPIDEDPSVAVLDARRGGGRD
jgi:hypothetical protein